MILPNKICLPYRACALQRFLAKLSLGLTVFFSSEDLTYYPKKALYYPLKRSPFRVFQHSGLPCMLTYVCAPYNPPLYPPALADTRDGAGLARGAVLHVHETKEDSFRNISYA